MYIYMYTYVYIYININTTISALPTFRVYTIHYCSDAQECLLYTHTHTRSHTHTLSLTHTYHPLSL